MKRWRILVALLVVASATLAKKERDDSEDAYAKSLIAALEKVRNVHDLRFDAEHHAIVGGDGMNLSTKNLYAEWLALPEEKRDAAVQRTVRVISSSDKAGGEPLDRVRDRLLPAVRAAVYFAWSEFVATEADLARMAPARSLFAH